jgi:hypothetical protein
LSLAFGSVAGRLARAALLLSLSHSELALGQGQLPDMAPIGAQPAKRAPSGADPKAPETHAAPGEESTLSTGDEPSLPADPGAISEETRRQIGTDGEVEEDPPEAITKKGFYGLYYFEKSLTERYRLVFPLWVERLKQVPSLKDPTKLETDRASAYGGFYYNRRGPHHADDMLFPVFWNLRDPALGNRTTVVGPFVNRRAGKTTDDWLFPLYMTGTREHGGYTVVPPLLTSLHSDEKGGFNLVGPAFCSWTGGPRCDTRTASDIELGIAPFYFFGQNQQRLYEIVPPLLHYYSHTVRSESWLNVWGPYYRGYKGVRPDGNARDIFHFLPLYYSIWGKKERHTTILPFVHVGYKSHAGEVGKTDESLLVTPLFLNKVDDRGAKTFVTWGYARHRGQSELDMITPLYWQYRQPSIGLERKIFFPFLYTNTSPRETTVAFVPFFAQRERFGISKSTWVTPLFNYQTHLEGWSFALNPVLYFGKNGDADHRVVAPIFFDFESRTSRDTVAFPLFWRFSKPDVTTTLVGNVLHREKRHPSGAEWEVHILPLFSFGGQPDGHFWNLLFGLTGYSQHGSKSTMRLFYLPIELSQ